MKLQTMRVQATLIVEFIMLKCKGHLKHHWEGDEFECDYDAQITCEDCIINGGAYSPQTNKLFRGNAEPYLKIVRLKHKDDSVKRFLNNFINLSKCDCENHKNDWCKCLYCEAKEVLKLIEEENNHPIELSEFDLNTITSKLIEQL